MWCDTFHLVVQAHADWDARTPLARYAQCRQKSANLPFEGACHARRLPRPLKTSDLDWNLMEYRSAHLSGQQQEYDSAWRYGWHDAIHQSQWYSNCWSLHKVRYKKGESFAQWWNQFDPDNADERYALQTRPASAFPVQQDSLHLAAGTVAARLPPRYSSKIEVSHHAQRQQAFAWRARHEDCDHSVGVRVNGTQDTTQALHPESVVGSGLHDESLCGSVDHVYAPLLLSRIGGLSHAESYWHRPLRLLPTH